MKLWIFKSWFWDNLSFQYLSLKTQVVTPHFDHLAYSKSTKNWNIQLNPNSVDQDKAANNEPPHMAQGL